MKAIIKQTLPHDPNWKLDVGDDIRFIFTYEGSSLISPLEDQTKLFKGNKSQVYLSNQSELCQYNNQVITGKYLGKSRIGRIDMIEIDLEILKLQIRENKIDSILK